MCGNAAVLIGIRDPTFIRAFKAKHCQEAFVEHQGTKKKCVRPRFEYGADVCKQEEVMAEEGR